MALVRIVQHCAAGFWINKSKLLIYLLLISSFVTLNYIVLVRRVCDKQQTHISSTLAKDSDDDFYSKRLSISEKKCETIHIGVVCIGTTNNLFFYTLLKSLYFYRTNPLHFHVLVDNISNVSIYTLFDTWSITHVNISVYNVNNYLSKVSWLQTHHYSGVYGLSKLLFPEIVPEFVIKIIILDTDIIFNANIFELWMLFNSFNENQFIGLVENESDFYVKQNLHWPALGRGYNTGIILCHLQKMKRFNWNAIWFEIANNTVYSYGSTSLADQDVINAVITNNTVYSYGSTSLADQDVINAVIRQHPSILFEISCNWNVQLGDHTFSYQCYRNKSIKVIHWNSPRKLNTMNKDGNYFKNTYTIFAEMNGNLLRSTLNTCAFADGNYFKNTYTIFAEMNGNLLRSTLNTCAFADKQGGIQRLLNPCDKFQQRSLDKWRTLLFFRNYEYTNSNLNDITFVAQFSYDRIHMLVDLLIMWKGPMTLTLYATDREFQQVISFLNNIGATIPLRPIPLHVFAYFSVRRRYTPYKTQ
ncbi:Glycosyl transferase family 8 [Popillia japonica]|uniref:Glycosyl transferase family 8 n=1 Tax=Popillia japonica TaxID=7064 RepID=A0AAW1M1T7_POPJA